MPRRGRCGLRLGGRRGLRLRLRLRQAEEEREVGAEAAGRGAGLEDNGRELIVEVRLARLGDGDAGRAGAHGGVRERGLIRNGAEDEVVRGGEPRIGLGTMLA